MSSTKTLNKQLRSLTKNPLPGVAFQLADDDKLTVWDLLVQVEVKQIIIDFPVRIEFHETDYPAKAPAVGFAVSFGYYQTGQGAEFEQTGGSLEGGVCICNSAFGGFYRAVHDDLAASGTGYSPAGGLEPVILNIQCILGDTISLLTPSERQSFDLRLQRFKDRGVWNTPDIDSIAIPLNESNSKSDEILDTDADASIDEITQQLEEQTLSSSQKDIASLSAEQIIALTSDETKKELLVLLKNHFKIPLPDIRCWFNMEEISNPKEVFGFLINIKTQWNRGKVGYTVTMDGHWTSFSSYNTMKSQGSCDCWK